MQPRLERYRGSRALSLMEDRRFRAAYDFLCLRATIDPELEAVAEWWTEVQTIDDREQQQSMEPRCRKATVELSVKPRYLAIEGPIGVGKSSLAKLLAEKMGAEYLSDTDAVNPWLEAFYRDPAANALHTQLHFLASRIESLERQQPQAAEGSRRGVRPLIADFMLDKDPLFAWEQRIDSAYLDGLSRLYEKLFHNYSASPLLIVNSESVDFTQDTGAVDRLLARIDALDGGRHFFNPV